ncbi:conserved hypothetical protein [Trichinella spiralis]|uniref:hypothetical protein n=1 Tax=Trichinella spiralis TaxID=6334 RepID=UPI0001EFE79D|nr:conserved hypothetical protein [Trichinella spiralis]
MSHVAGFLQTAPLWNRISRQVIMASDGTYWYLLAYFDKILPDMDDKPKNRALARHGPLKLGIDALFSPNNLLKYSMKNGVNIDFRASVDVSKFRRPVLAMLLMQCKIPFCGLHLKRKYSIRGFQVTNLFCNPKCVNMLIRCRTLTLLRFAFVGQLPLISCRFLEEL